jgi:uncharacterized protein YigE (DUF2233 family)
MNKALPVVIAFAFLLATIVLGACTHKSNGLGGVENGSKPAVTAAKQFTTVRVNVRTEPLQIFLRDEHGKPFNRFDKLTAWLAGRNRQLRFAMNAGMYQPDFSPVGLLVEDGQQIAPLNVGNGTGNFFLKPNGVFFVASTGPRIVETSEYPALARDVKLATQSGPLLVRNGIVNAAFDPASTSRLIRNGVGISQDVVMFVISEEPVTFYELAVYFRDELKCPDALYLDGAVSSLYSVELHRNDSRFDLGPIVGVVR